jgi:hypothetical protein
MFEPDTTLAELAENYHLLDELGLLTDHDLTANLLYHNQIVLYGSAAWDRFEREGRLLQNPRLPFEARCRFKDERVEVVCSAMGRLTADYFKRMDDIRREGTASGALCLDFPSPGVPTRFNGEDLNIHLKDAFRALCSAAESMNYRQFSRLEEQFLLRLNSILG